MYGMAGWRSHKNLEAKMAYVRCYRAHAKEDAGRSLFCMWQSCGSCAWRVWSARYALGLMRKRQLKGAEHRHVEHRPRWAIRTRANCDWTRCARDTGGLRAAIFWAGGVFVCVRKDDEENTQKEGRPTWRIKVDRTGQMTDIARGGFEGKCGRCP